jgi:hypothetical protein
MAKQAAKYTLWTIPKSEWSQSMLDFGSVEVSPEDVVRFAQQLDRKRLDGRLRPFDTPATQEILDESSDSK